jgi:arsenite methyltransferase
MDVDELVDAEQLRAQVREKYREVAADPHRTFHFHTGRRLAARLGYDADAVDALPDRAVESFAGVGNPFALRHLEPGERVVDVGSGAGFDSFIAAGQVGASGTVVGVDMTAEMLEKSTETAHALGLDHVEFRPGFAEQLPVEEGWADVVISNGVINLAPDKDAVFAAAAQALSSGGRLAIADIVSERELIERTRRNVALWAACIAGAVPRDDYLGAIEAAGLRIETVRENTYTFLSPRAQQAADKYGVTSVSVLARKP